MISILYPNFLYGFPYNFCSLCLGNLCRPKELYNIQEKTLVYLHVASKGEKHKKEKMSKK